MGGSACVLARTGSSASAFAPSGISARVSGLKTSAVVLLQFIGTKQKRHTESKIENEERGCAEGGLRRNEEEPVAGERIPSSLQTNASGLLANGSFSPRI